MSARIAHGIRDLTRTAGRLGTVIPRRPADDGSLPVRPLLPGAQAVRLSPEVKRVVNAAVTARGDEHLVVRDGDGGAGPVAAGHRFRVPGRLRVPPPVIQAVRVAAGAADAAGRDEEVRAGGRDGRR